MLILSAGLLVISAATSQALADTNDHFGRDAGVIYLTFDDGPHPMYTPMILDLLEQYGAQATFFPLGHRLEERWELHQVEDLLNRGHALGNHSWRHQRLTTLSQVDIEHELDSASTVIERRTGFRPRCFRAPYGEIDTTVLEVGRRLGMEHVAWGADPQEWRSPTVENALKHVKDRLDDGLVILMHDRKWMTLPILAELLRALPADRWHFKALPQCGARGNPLARMADRGDEFPPIGSIWGVTHNKNMIQIEGWAYHPKSPAGGLQVTVNANGEAVGVVGVTGPSHRFSLTVEAPAKLVPVCAWAGEVSRLGLTASLGCVQPVLLPGN